MSSDPSQQPSISYQDGDALRVIYTLPPTPSPHLDSVLFFTVPKSGTVMLTKLMGSLAPPAGLSLVYIIGELFQLGILPANAPASTADIFLPKGYCYGFPDLPTEFEIPLIGRVKSILLVRDPRDLLVSLYFSSRFSHPVPGQAESAVKDKATGLIGRTAAETMDIDSFAVEYAGDFYHGMLRRYMALAGSPGVRVFRYEDVIYDKIQWARDICGHYGWKIADDELKAAVALIDVFPDKERPQDHVRQVHPGNYKEKLKPETIARIEDICAEEMAFFGYERHQPARG